ncbi:hypothetical protein BDN70DRAFT_190926 [Pholiota conissans]|uniref:Uncharacterized protein n=1 Tax=Pholiota conissans TaxID=109636 RepID=A0A9P6CWZ4_9AGAR|nr:hypothetical protein BDN70DRAFT_190926 [Pholiota conissans]
MPRLYAQDELQRAVLCFVACATGALVLCQAQCWLIIENQVHHVCSIARISERALVFKFWVNIFVQVLQEFLTRRRCIAIVAFIVDLPTDQPVDKRDIMLVTICLRRTYPSMWEVYIWIHAILNIRGAT